MQRSSRQQLGLRLYDATDNDGLHSDQQQDKDEFDVPLKVVISHSNNGGVMVAGQGQNGVTMVTTNKIQDLDYVYWTRSPFYRAFEPLLFSLKLLGLRHTKYEAYDDNDDARGEGQGRCSRLKACCRACTPSQVYAWTVTIVAWMFLCQTMYGLTHVPGGMGLQLLASLIQTFWVALCAINGAFFVRICHHNDSIAGYFRGIARLKRYDGGVYTCPNELRKGILIVSIVCWLVTAINGFVFGYLAFNSPVLDPMYTNPLLGTDDPRRRHVVKVMSMVFVVYMSALWTFPSAVELSLTLFIWREFRYFHRAFGNKLTDDGQYGGVSLEHDRRRYLEMSRIIEHADSCLCLHHGATFCCGIAIICLLLYCLIYYSLDNLPGASLAFVFWVVTTIIDIAVVTVAGILVSSAVRNLNLS